MNAPRRYRPAAAALLVLASLAGAAGPAAAVAPSAGCAAPPPAVPPHSIVVGGRERAVIVAVPEDYAPDRPHPLIVAFHGRTNDNRRVRRYYGLERQAWTGAIFAYPAGLRDDSGRFAWADPADPADALRDYALFDRLVAELAARYCVDRDAVFVVGHSLGASFANSLACARGARIRAVAAVAGGIAPTDCAGRVAALLLHNPADRLVPVSEGERARDVFLAQNGADARSRPVELAGFACRRYGSAAHPVLWCPHRVAATRRGRHDPHQWPPGAGAAIMTFFETVAGGPGAPPARGSAGSG